MSENNNITGIKTLPIFLIMGPLLWGATILWGMFVKLFDKFQYNMISMTLMLILAIPLYLLFGVVGALIAVVALFLRFKISEARAEELIKISLKNKSKNINKSKVKNKRK